MAQEMIPENMCTAGDGETCADCDEMCAMSRDIGLGLGIQTVKPEGLGSLQLAYIGDAIYELFVRQIVMSRGFGTVNELNSRATALTRATAQCKIALSLLDGLTEEEAAVYRRGRNVRSVSAPKNCSISEYRSATGFEALCGWLYLTGKDDRLMKLVRKGIALFEESK